MSGDSLQVKKHCVGGYEMSKVTSSFECVYLMKKRVLFVLTYCIYILSGEEKMNPVLLLLIYRYSTLEHVLLSYLDRVSL